MLDPDLPHARIQRAINTTAINIGHVSVLTCAFHFQVFLGTVLCSTLT